MCRNHNILKYFNLIDIDDKITELAKKGLKVVPTIFIKELNKPIEGKNVFAWLESVIAMNSNKMFDKSNEQYLPELGINQNSLNSSNNSNSSNYNTNVVKRTIVAPPPIIKTNENKKQVEPDKKIINGVEINTNTNPIIKNQPFGFLQEELSGFSDTFAYLNFDNPLPKSFLPCDKDLEIYTAPEGNKLDKRNQDMLIKNMEMIRDNDKNNFIKQIEQEHNNLLNKNLLNK
jgi:hypothetical protein